jgi:hypothetical protein
MSCDNPTDRGSGDPASPAEEDARVEAAVLAFLLDEYPDCLTIPELSLALNDDPGDFSSNDAVERAVRELDGGGLLHCRGGLAVPTRAALYFARLEVD